MVIPRPERSVVEGPAVHQFDHHSRSKPRSPGNGSLTLRFLIGNVSSVKLLPLLVFLCSGLFGSPLAQCQTSAASTSAAEWPTGSFNQQRDAWQRNETKVSVDTAKDIRLLWQRET